MARRVSARGVDVVTFNFLYTEQHRRTPDRAPVLEQTWRAVLEQVVRHLEPPGRVAVGGKSMGGRIASHMAAHVPRGSGVAEGQRPRVAGLSVAPAGATRQSASRPSAGHSDAHPPRAGHSRHVRHTRGSRAGLQSARRPRGPRVHRRRRPRVCGPEVQWPNRSRRARRRRRLCRHLAPLNALANPQTFSVFSASPRRSSQCPLWRSVSSRGDRCSAPCPSPASDRSSPLRGEGAPSPPPRSALLRGRAYPAPGRSRDRPAAFRHPIVTSVSHHGTSSEWCSSAMKFSEAAAVCTLAMNDTGVPAKCIAMGTPCSWA